MTAPTTLLALPTPRPLATITPQPTNTPDAGSSSDARAQTIQLAPEALAGTLQQEQQEQQTAPRNLLPLGGGLLLISAGLLLQPRADEDDSLETDEEDIADWFDDED
jgi:hypothetical protein